jgi:asparagine synthase (glutamine-hydrolysing)
MGDAIAHRGPDGEGFHIDAGPPAVGLVNRRLAVIDVAGGDQPITVCDGAFTIVYNGELFNTAEVRRELEAAGHGFRTDCDTEVVVRGYAEWGREVLDRLIGMWAFAIWDRPARTLFLARDRLGVKPLVYARLPNGVAFASEIKALVAGGVTERRLNPEALPHYLSAFAVPEPYSLVAGVTRLRAGHALLASPGGVEEYSYWDCAVPEEEDRGADGYREEIGDLVEDAVRRQLVSDVPLGVLLSGGIDSRLVATFAARAHPGLNTFTLGFDDPAADERSTSRAVARGLGAVHHESVLHVDDGAVALPALLEAYDEPGQSLTQTHFISRFAREHVTVALSGLGGDELFAAYPTHVAVNVLARLDQLPLFARRMVHEAALMVPSRRMRRLSELAGLEADSRVTQELLHQTSAGLRRALLAPAVREEVDLEGPVRHLEEHYSRARAHHPLNRLLYVYLKTYLTDELLRATDAMSMLHSLELRVPLLDHRLVERAMRMPAERKMRLTRGKLVLREIARDTLDESASGPKRGFSPPVARWLKGPLGDQVCDVLAPAAVRRRGIFDPVMVQSVLSGCLAGDDRLIPPVMMLYSFEEWARRWLDAEAPEPAPGPPVEIRAPAAPELSVVIVNWNTRELVCACIASVQRHLGAIPHEIILVDNASSDGSADAVAERFPDVRLLRNSDNVGFGRANNQAMRVARGDWFLLLNSDTELTDDSVARLFERIRDEAEPNLGVAQCSLILPDGRLQNTAYRFPSLRLALLDDLGLHRVMASDGGALLGGYWDHTTERDVDWIAGAFMLLRRQVFDQTQGFDERLFMYGEDLEWCTRIHDLGWRIRYYPSARLSHHDHASSDLLWGDERIAICLQRERDIYAERHGRLSALALIAIKAAGASLRVGYYTLRAARPGAANDTYRTMLPHQRRTLRAVYSVLVGRE